MTNLHEPHFEVEGSERGYYRGERPPEQGGG
jgi:hypothetical protein